MSSVSRRGRPTSDEIKTVRKAFRLSYNTENAKKAWKETYTEQQLEKCYRYNPNKNNSKIGKGATTHILDSDGMREELSDHTPIHHPSIIPLTCTLRFFYANSFHSSQHTVLSHPIKLSRRFHNVDQMRNIFNDRLYTSQLIIKIAETTHAFWVKSFKQSALDRAFGIQVSDYIMRYRAAIYVELGSVIMKLSGKNIGVGFCNLTQNDKGVEGHRMIHLEAETMDTVCIQFYATNSVSMRDISVEVKTHQQKKKRIVPKKETPLLLLDGSRYLHCEGEIVQCENTLTAQEEIHNTLVRHPLPSIHYNGPQCQMTESHTTEPHTTEPHTTEPHTTEPHTTEPHTDYPLFPDTESLRDQMPFTGFDNDSVSGPSMNDTVSTISPRYMMYHDSILSSPAPFGLNTPDMMDEVRQQKPQRVFQGMAAFNNPRNGMHRTLRRRREGLEVSRVDSVKYMRSDTDKNVIGI